LRPFKEAQRSKTPEKVERKERRDVRLEKRHLYACLVLAILLSSTTASASAQNVVPVDTNRRDNVEHQGVLTSPNDGKDHLYKFVVTLKPNPPVSCTYDKTEENILTSNFSSWTFNNSTGELPGSYDIARCDAGRAESQFPTTPNNWDNNILHFFEVDYNNSGLPPIIPAGGNLTWIQFIYTNYPKIEKSSQPYVDPQPNDDNMPFYFTGDEMKDNNAFGLGLKIYNRNNDKVNMTFYDSPARDWKGIVQKNLNPMTWKAHLYAAVWNSTKIVTVIYKGVEWGFQITWADLGQQAAGPAVPWNSGGVAGDKDWILGPDLYSTAVHGVVGGFTTSISIQKLKPGLLAPYIGLVFTIVVALVATPLYVNRTKRRKNE
jgi:hypothetical protein